MAIVTAGRAQLKNVWVKLPTPAEEGVREAASLLACGRRASHLGAAVLCCWTVMVIDTLCVCRERGISKLFSSSKSEECVKGESVRPERSGH